ncbi:TPA: type II pantothenate kinase, partial [Bacillus thuringiensis]|nr:type II pantothenate kinase [Bacillus thuringiensis]
MERTIGIDAGGTLTKIAYFNEKKLLTFEKFYSHEQHKIIDWIKNNNG